MKNLVSFGAGGVEKLGVGLERASALRSAHRSQVAEGLRGPAAFRAREISHKKYLPALDGLRGLAILAVFLFHYAGGTLKQPHTFIANSVSVLIGFGWTGVDLFFVLSGFLITGILLDTRDSPRFYRNFYARRALRIVPAYYLLLTIYVLLTPILHLHWKLEHLLFGIYLGYPAALVWPGLQVIAPIVVVVHLWSLCAEEQFYLVWPTIIARVKKREAILWTCAGLSCGAILLRTAMVWTHKLDPSWEYGFLPCRMDTLALGAALAVLVRSPWRALLQRWNLTAFIGATGAIMMVCTLRHSVDRYDPVIASVGYSIIALAYGTLLLNCLDRGGLCERIFASRPLRLFGRYSYGMYLYHLPLASILHPMKDYLIVATRSYLAGSATYLASALGINLIIAGLSFHLFESPILRLKERFRS